AKTSASVLKKLFLAIALLGVLSPFLMAQPATTEANPQNKNWESYSPETLSTLLDANDPIFVNMTAAWCITCKVNERIAIKTEKTNKLFEELNVQYLKGDWTNRDPKITAYLKEFNRQGVPLYVFYPGRSSDTGQRPDPVLLPQILTSQIINETIAP
ncbi:MAG: thioredoxin family protein, partial [Pseudomonadota bacterium]